MSLFSVSLLRRASPFLLASVALAATGGDAIAQAGSTGPIEILAGQSIVAFGAPSGLVASTGNLYWTANAFNEFGADTSSVWRAGKTNTPGGEFLLYRETGDDRFFGAIVFANPGAFFGYFVANYRSPTGVMTSQIKRVPLTGGAAVVIANSPAPIGNRDLVTDGTTLFWVDAEGIRSVPLAGGAVTTLRASSFITRLRVDPNFLYYGEEFLIFRLPKTGGFGQVMVSTSGRVSALHVDPAAGWLFWGEVGGGVRANPLTPGNAQFTYQQSIAGRDATAVGFDGVRVLWSDCAQPGNTSCRNMKMQAGVVSTLTSGSVGVGLLQWDAGAIFWGDVGNLRKYVH